MIQIKSQILDILRQYFTAQLSIVLNEELPNAERIKALLKTYSTGSWFKSIKKNDPLLWLRLARNNWLLFCGNNAVDDIDPLGLWTNNNIWDVVTSSSASDSHDPCEKDETRREQNEISDRMSSLAGAIGIAAGAETISVGIGIAIGGGPPGWIVGGVISITGGVLMWGGIELIHPTEKPPISPSSDLMPVPDSSQINPQPSGFIIM